MKNIIQDILEESIALQRTAIEQGTESLLLAAKQMARAIVAGNKLLFFGNGGSAADAQHLAAEFVNRFRIERPPLAAIALTTDSSILTSIGNDYDFNQIFVKQINALGTPGDLAIGISTSGNSPNVLSAIEAARAKDLYTIALVGHGGRLADLADLVLKAPHEQTARIQETHIVMGHILCELVDRILFPAAFDALPNDPRPSSPEESHG